GLLQKTLKCSLDLAMRERPRDFVSIHVQHPIARVWSVLVELDVAAPVRKRRHDVDAARLPACVNGLAVDKREPIRHGFEVDFRATSSCHGCTDVSKEHARHWSSRSLKERNSRAEARELPIAPEMPA